MESYQAQELHLCEFGIRPPEDLGLFNFEVFAGLGAAEQGEITRYHMKPKEGSKVKGRKEVEGTKGGKQINERRIGRGHIYIYIYIYTHTHTHTYI
jgi:hypothetical protein